MGGGYRKGGIPLCQYWRKKEREPESDIGKERKKKQGWEKRRKERKKIVLVFKIHLKKFYLINYTFLISFFAVFI